MRLPTSPTRRALAGASRGPKIAPRRPTLPFLVEQAPSPVDQVTALDSDIEGQTEQVLDEVTKAFRAREAVQLAEVKDYAPIEFFRVLVFQTPVQARAFMRAVGQEESLQYLDGRKVCDTLGISIPADEWKPKRSLMAPNKRLAAFAMPLPRRPKV